MFTQKEKNKLQKMNKLFGQIDDIFRTFSIETQDYILNYHTENSSIPHCIRWGINNTLELVENVETVYKIGTEFVVKEDLEFGVGRVPKGSKAKLAFIRYDLLKEEDCKAFQFDFDTFEAYKEEDKSDGFCEELSLKEVKKYLFLWEI